MLQRHLRRALAGLGGEVMARSGLSVLVVDDNVVSQRVVVALLAELGHAADVADNGFQALEQLARRSYDAILMDLEMPAMDGFAAARIIRDREAHHRRRVVIIAVSARAPADVQARLRSAGIDDLLPKPVTAAQLDTALAEGLRARSEASAISSDPPAAAVILDPRSVATLRRLGLLTAVLGLFGESLTRHHTALREAVAAGDRSRALRSAHSLRGAAAQIGARQIAQACSDLEEAARDEPEGASERLRAAFLALDGCVEPLQEALRREIAVGDAPP